MPGDETSALEDSAISALEISVEVPVVAPLDREAVDMVVVEPVD